MNVRELATAIVTAFLGEAEFGFSNRMHRSGVSNDEALERLIRILESEDSNRSRDWSDAECVGWMAIRAAKRGD